MTTAARPGLDLGLRPAKNMPGTPTPLSVLGPQIEAARQKIRQQFEDGASARETVHALCELADRSIQQIFGEMQRARGSETEGLSLTALGGYGRQLLFPFSDLDILFLFSNEKTEQESKKLIAEFSRMLWDLGFRVSSAGRTIEECKRIEEDNAEFHLALLDRRFLAGDKELFEKLDEKVLPSSERQARPFMLGQLQKLTKDRLTRYGNTIFHLEPNVKESPGGLRDYQATSWLRQTVDLGWIRMRRKHPLRMLRNGCGSISAMRELSIVNFSGIWSRSPRFSRVCAKESLKQRAPPNTNQATESLLRFATAC